MHAPPVQFDTRLVAIGELDAGGLKGGYFGRLAPTSRESFLPQPLVDIRDWRADLPLLGRIRLTIGTSDVRSPAANRLDQPTAK
jgi:hypothetical protein